MATLRDVALEVRVRALRELLRAEPGLSAEQRAELVAAAVWPDPVDLEGLGSPRLNSPG